MQIKFIIRKTHEDISAKNHLIIFLLQDELIVKKILVQSREGELRDNILVLASLFFLSFNISLRELCNLVPA